VNIQNHVPVEKQGLLETHQALITMTALVLMVLPFITTFDEFLTAIVMRSNAYVAIQNLIVPYEGKMIAVILRAFGYTAYTSGSIIIIPEALRIYISWNCIGWQSLVLFAMTLLTGLRGPYTLRSKALCVLIGVQGTLLLNLLRISSVILVALFAGYLPALIFHDYGGTALVVLWLVFYWHMAFHHILRDEANN